MAKRKRFDPKLARGARRHEGAESEPFPGLFASSHASKPSPAESEPDPPPPPPLPPPSPKQARTADALPWSVSRLAECIGDALAKHIPLSVCVEGEITGPRERTHWYFDLKDEHAVIACVLFRGAAKKSAVTPLQGQRVVVRGRVDYYARGGKVSLIAESIEPVGAGALDAQLKQLVEEMRGLGWLDPSRKREPPFFPRRIAVVTSRSAAALQDVLDTMRRRCPAVGVLLADVRVQGEGSAAEVAQAVRLLSTHAEQLGIDAVLVTRGGGSMEDLWAFNDRGLARAIVECSVPVVAAIGHETDTTIAELVADVRCATPTQAAMRLTPDRSALRNELDAHAARLRAAVLRRLDLAHRDVRSLAQRPCMTDPAWPVTHGRERALRAAQALHAAAARRLEGVWSEARRAATELRAVSPANLLARARERLHALEHATLAGLEARLHAATSRTIAIDKHLRAVSPLHVLERGYSITTKAGVAIKDARHVAPGDVVTTRVARGAFCSKVGNEQAP